MPRILVQHFIHVYCGHTSPSLILLPSITDPFSLQLTPFYLHGRGRGGYRWVTLWSFTGAWAPYQWLHHWGKCISLSKQSLAACSFSGKAMLESPSLIHDRMSMGSIFQRLCASAHSCSEFKSIMACFYCFSFSEKCSQLLGPQQKISKRKQEREK